MRPHLWFYSSLLISLITTTYSFPCDQNTPLGKGTYLMSRNQHCKSIISLESMPRYPSRTWASSIKNGEDSNDANQYRVSSEIQSNMTPGQPSNHIPAFPYSNIHMSINSLDVTWDLVQSAESHSSLKKLESEWTRPPW